MNCPQCSAPMPSGNNFCTACGTRLPAVQQPATGEDFLGTTSYIFYLFVLSLPIIGAFVSLILGFFVSGGQNRRRLARAVFFYHMLFIFSVIAILIIYILGKLQ